MTTNRVQHRTLRDLGRFETRTALFQCGIKATLRNCMRKDVFEERVRELNELISRLERKIDAETKSLAARCDRLEREVASMRETLKQGETSVKGIVSKPIPPQDPALSRAFSGKDLEVMTKGVDALKQWTGKATATIVYDSTKDPFTDDGLFYKVKGKPNIALVGFTTKHDVFGGFYSNAVMQQDKQVYDWSMFAFSFESRGRCETPKRFPVKEGRRGNAIVSFWKNDSYGFVQFGVDFAGCFWFGNERSKSYCCTMSSAFDGLKNKTLTGKTGTYDNGPYHHYARLVAIQLD